MGKAASTDPASPEMKTAWDCYDAGDIVSARRLARAVLRAPVHPADADQARDLLKRTGLPRQVYGIALVAVGLLAFLWLLAMHRGAVAH